MIKMTSQQQLSKLAVLPPNKTVVFYSPVEGRDVLVRTGIIGEDNCFLHALLHAHSKDYVQLDKNERIQFVSKLRANLAEKLDKKRWEEISAGLAVQIPFQEHTRDILQDFYNAIQKNRSSKSSKNVYKTLINQQNDSKNDLDAYQIVCELIPLDDMKNTLADAYSKFGDEKIDKCKSIIIAEFRKLAVRVFDGLGNELDDTRKKYCVNKVVKMMTEITNEADSKAYKNYLTNLKDTTIPVDAFSIALFSDRFNRDIYFIDSKTRMPYQMVDKSSVKGRKGVILIWLGGTHYEVVGKLLPGNRIQREFYKDDPLIKRINVFVYKPECVSEQYPNLVPYLPKEDREKIGFFDQSVSHSESRSTEPETESKSSSNASSPSPVNPNPNPKRKQSKRRSRHHSK